MVIWAALGSTHGLAGGAIGRSGERTVASAHRHGDKIALGIDHVLGALRRGGKTSSFMAMMGVTVTKKVAAVALLCAVVALVACRREEYRPLKPGGPVAEQPAR